MGRSVTCVSFTWLLAVASLAACGNKRSALDERSGADSIAAAGSAGPAPVDAPPEKTGLTAKRLAPIIHELGVDHVVPTAIVIEAAAPIIAGGGNGVPSARTKLKITPEVPGSLAYTATSELTFTPAEPLAFDTTYKVDVAAIETSDGVIDAPAGAPWTYTFKTPSFAFLSWAPTEVNATAHKATMELAFSGAVLPNVARAAMTFTVDGAPVVNVQALPSHQPSMIDIALSDPRIKLGSKLEIQIKGLHAVADATAPAASATYVVSADKAMSIKTAMVTEGGNGFYVEVVCDDQAAPAGNRAYYGEEGYYNLSQRCQLSDDAIAHVHFDPPVKHAYITSGRAGFRVFGDFHRGTYSMAIDAGAMTVDGGVLLAPFARSFSVAARKPALAFAASGRYLPRTAWSNLGIKHLNVDAVNLVIRQVPQENLIFWMGNDGTDVVDEHTSNVILKKEIKLRGDADQQATTWLDVASLLPADTKGVLELKLIGVGTQATSRLLLTNLSLVAKKTAPAAAPWAQTVQVWALDMDSAGLVDGVDMSLVRKSGKVVARCTTHGGDGCTLAAPVDGDPDQAEPFAVIARKGDDLTYLRYSDLRADVAESSTGGAAYVAESPYRAAVFSDRGVYRPGDTAHVVSIVRDAHDKAPAQPLPVEAQVIDPRAKVVKKLELKTNAAGMLALDEAFPPFADTGHWRVQLTVADKPLADYDLQVEEFVPERMKVTSTPAATDVLMGAPVELAIDAQYLFGGTAVDSGVTLSCSVEPTRFVPKENADLTYGVEPRGKPVNLGDAQGQLDPKGHVQLACTNPPGAAPFASTARLTATASVLEAGSGRATVKTATATIHPEKYYLGVRTKASHAAAGETFTVEGLVVDWNGKPMPAAVREVNVELIHLESDYGYSYDDDSGDSRFDRWMRRVPEGKQTVKVTNGTFKLDVTPAEADLGYVVRVSAGNAKTELVLDGQYPYYYDAYGDNDHTDQTPRPAKPSQLAVNVPEDIEVGKEVTVKVRSPYKGRVLWTVETDHVITAEWKDIAAGDSQWSFTLDAFAPNVYVSAFVVKDPHLESKDAFLPDRAFGIASARVTPTAFTQTIAIEAPKDVRSSSPLAVTVTGAPNSFAVVSVVDEGILSLTNFQTPDPNAELFAKRALAVETYETIGWTMLHQPAGASSKTGGGDDSAGDQGALGKSRVQPVKPVALFSGIVAIGADGKTTIPFAVPSYRGELRVMAITADATKIGRAEADVIVKDPLVVQVTFPRFIAMNDQIEVPVFMTNLSGGPLDVSVHLTAEPIAVPGIVTRKDAPAPLAFTGKDTGSVHINNTQAETLVFQVKAMMAVGGAKLRVVAKAGAITETDEVDVPFLPPGPKEHATQKLKVAAGKLDVLAAATALKGWMPTTETTTFWLTPNPYGEAFEHLKYLVHYPYGCIEQTTSSTLPLLHVASLVEQLDPDLANVKIEDMVLAGIQRVLSMETPSGGFGYWPGATEPLEWATAYATYMLLDAKKAGYAVPEDRLKEVLKWIEGRVAAYERGEHIAHEPWNHYDEQSEAYLHYVLALAGKGKKARIQKLIADIPAHATGEQAEDLYMLKAALWVAGDRRYEKDLKAVDTSPIVDQRINSWSFYSDLRRRGFMLSTFSDLFGNDPAGELLAQRVAEALAAQPSSYYNTQELVWGVVGLGKWVAPLLAKGTAAAGTLTADGAVIAARSPKTKGAMDKTWTLRRASEYGSLSLDLPASAAGLWLVIDSDGVRPGNSYKVGGNGLSVTRSYHKLDATEVDLAQGQTKLGDLIFVEIDLANPTSVVTQNLALVDRLPAGFEIENPRLGRTTKPDWVKDDDLWAMDFMNLRDDRLEAFGTLDPGETKKVVYTIRAVTSGTFAVPPVEAMYDPTLWARGAGGTCVIGGPWTGKTL